MRSRDPSGGQRVSGLRSAGHFGYAAGTAAAFRTCGCGTRARACPEKSASEPSRVALTSIRAPRVARLRAAPYFQRHTDEFRAPRAAGTGRGPGSGRAGDSASGPARGNPRSPMAGPGFYQTNPPAPASRPGSTSVGAGVGPVGIRSSPSAADGSERPGSRARAVWSAAIARCLCIGPAPADLAPGRPHDTGPDGTGPSDITGRDISGRGVGSCSIGTIGRYRSAARPGRFG